MEKPKVGFVAVTCPTHIEEVDETGTAWIEEKETQMAVQALEKAGLELIKHDAVICSVEEAVQVADRFLAEDADCMMIFIQTWNWAAQVMQAALKFNRPIILWALPISHVWSIGGLAVTHGSFDEVGIPHKVVYGLPDEPGVMESIVRYAKAARVKNVLRKSHYGSIGGQGMGIHTGIIDANQWLKQFGILVGFTDQYAVVVEAEKIPEEEVQNYYEQLQKEYGEVPEFNQVTNRAIRVYLGLEKIIEREGYDFTGVKCTFDLSDNYCSACLAQSRLSSRGFVTACLNDSNGALSSYIMRLLTNEPLFTADVNLVDKKRNLVKLIDDGAGSIHLAKDPKKVKLGFQPTIECKASGVCTGLICRPGRITLARVARIQGCHVMHIAPGEAFEGEEAWVEECGYPMWPHAFLHLDGDLDEFVQNLRSEYIHMAYGDLTDDLVETCGLLGIEPIIT